MMLDLSAPRSLRLLSCVGEARLTLLHRLRIKVARIFNTYGPRMHPNDGRVVSNFVVQALRGDDITIYGDGSQTRSFCYVDDLILGFLKIMGSNDEITGPINLGNPREFTIRQLAEHVIELTGSKSSLRKNYRHRELRVPALSGVGTNAIRGSQRLR
jgi:nucleoside-diphosphate-sugar epimerase